MKHARVAESMALSKLARNAEMEMRPEGDGASAAPLHGAYARLRRAAAQGEQPRQYEDRIIYNQVLEAADRLRLETAVRTLGMGHVGRLVHHGPRQLLHMLDMRLEEGSSWAKVIVIEGSVAGAAPG